VQAPSQSYAEEMQRLKDWVHRRIVWMDANMPGTLTGCSMAGINELKAGAAVSAYPNPFSGTLVVEWMNGDLNGCTLRLRDETGRVFHEKTITTADLQEESVVLTGLSDLAQGVYFVEITRGSDRCVVKVMK
jgi:hypothetical protein